MPNFLELLRMNNIFGPTNPIQSTSPDISPVMSNPMPTNPMSMSEQPDDISPGDRITQLMQEYYKPETQATDAYNELVKQYPTQFKPSMLRKIGAAVTAFGPSGQKGAMDFLYEPYNQQLQAWKDQIIPAGKAADLERQSNINNRTLAYQTVSQRLRAEADAAKAKNDETRANAALQRAQAYEFKTRNPTLKFDFSGPTVLVADPTTGKVSNTGIATGALSDADKLALGQDNAIERIRETGEQARQTEDTRQDSRNWSVVNIPDPNDPTKQIAVRVNAQTGMVEPLKLGENQVGPIIKGSNANKGQPSNLQAIQDRTRETLNSLNELLDDKGKLRENAKSAVGASRMFGLQYLPATETRAGDAAIKRLKSLLIVDLIGEMKAQSRTGATGFGQLNLRELAVLENAASKLDPALDEATFEAELNRIREKLQKVLQPADSGSETVTEKKSKPTAADLIKKYGGGR